MYAEGQITTEFPDGTHKVEMEKVDPAMNEKINEAKKDQVPMGEVGYALGITLPTGAYANVRIDTRITLPAPVSEIDAVYEYCVEWADKRMAKAVAEAKEAYGLK